MARSFNAQQCLIRCLCVVLALVCAFSLVIPHLHECEGVQCQVCELCSVYENLWFPAALVVTLLIIVPLHKDLKEKEDITADLSLVQLKVKLSD